MRSLAGEFGWPTSTILQKIPETDDEKTQLIDTLQDWKTLKYQEIVCEALPLSLQALSPICAVQGSLHREYMRLLLTVSCLDALMARKGEDKHAVLAMHTCFGWHAASGKVPAREAMIWLIDEARADGLLVGVRGDRTGAVRSNDDNMTGSDDSALHLMPMPHLARS